VFFEDAEFDIGRRQLLGAAAVGAGGLVIAGCGGGDGKSSGSSTSTSKGTPATTAPKRGGTFRVGVPGGSTSDTLDSLRADDNSTNGSRCSALYNTLLLTNDETGQPDPLLAESVEPADDVSYWDVRLRDAEWHDGKPVTADDVIFSLRRALDPKGGAGAAGLLQSIDTKRLEKMDPRTVRLHLHAPDISVPYGLKNLSMSIVPVGYDPEKPIGSGPFKFKSFTPGQSSTFVRNDNYWDSGKPYLDELVLVDFADPNTTRINALTNGQIDAAVQIQYSFEPTLKSASNLEVLISKTYAYQTWEMRMDMAPFDDPRVRQAIMLIANRPEIVEQAFAGSRFGSIANEWPCPTDPLYDDSIPQRAQDIEKAKALLKDAGHEGLTVELTVSDVTAGIVETAQVLAQQAKAAGVTIKVNKISDAGTYFSKYWHQAPFKFDYLNTGSIWEHLGYTLLPGSAYNISNWKNPDWLKLVNQAKSEGDLDKRKEFMGEAQKIFFEEGTQGIFAFHNTLDAYSSKFAGATTSITGFGLNGLHFEGIGLA
jgi:peptide/nickel transport system substrate-binding protein